MMKNLESHTSEIPLSIDGTLQKLTEWRQTKATHKESCIPESIWQEIIALEQLLSVSALTNMFGITRQQFLGWKEKLSTSKSQTNHQETSSTNITQFCEAKPKPLTKPMQIEKSYTPATTTVIVEFYRADGQMMKIHTCSDQFKNFINDFLNG